MLRWWTVAKGSTDSDVVAMDRMNGNAMVVDHMDGSGRREYGVDLEIYM